MGTELPPTIKKIAEERPERRPRIDRHLFWVDFSAYFAGLCIGLVMLVLILH